MRQKRHGWAFEITSNRDTMETVNKKADTRPHYTQPVSSLSRKDCEALIALALSEDAPAGDPSSDALFSPDEQGEAYISAQEDGLICGLALLPFLLEAEQKSKGSVLHYHSDFHDGHVVKKEDKIASLSGSILSLLRLERVILNFLQYLSGIASQTARVIEIAGPHIVILDTRKTLPAFRRLAKYAVYCGGGTNHRISLSDMLMLKDNHIKAAGSLKQAVKKARSKYPELPLEVEVDSLRQLEELLELGVLEWNVEKVLLDNMRLDEIKRALLMIDKKGVQKEHRLLVEISGNWNKGNISQLKGLQNLALSMGALTHSVSFLDMSMYIQRKAEH